MKIHQDPYANLLSANYGVERPGRVQMPLRSRMTSYMYTSVTAVCTIKVYIKRGSAQPGCILKCKCEVVTRVELQQVILRTRALFD